MNKKKKNEKRFEKKNIDDKIIFVQNNYILLSLTLEKKKKHEKFLKINSGFSRLKYSSNMF